MEYRPGHTSCHLPNTGLSGDYRKHIISWIRKHPWFMYWWCPSVCPYVHLSRCQSTFVDDLSHLLTNSLSHRLQASYTCVCTDDISISHPAGLRSCLPWFLVRFYNLCYIWLVIACRYLLPGIFIVVYAAALKTSSKWTLDWFKNGQSDSASRTATCIFIFSFRLCLRVSVATVSMEILLLMTYSCPLVLARPQVCTYLKWSSNVKSLSHEDNNNFSI